MLTIMHRCMSSPRRPCVARPSGLKRKQQAKEEAWKRQRAEEAAAKEAERARTKSDLPTAAAATAAPSRLAAPIVWGTSSGGQCPFPRTQSTLPTNSSLPAHSQPCSGTCPPVVFLQRPQAPIKERGQPAPFFSALID